MYRLFRKMTKHLMQLHNENTISFLSEDDNFESSLTVHYLK